MLAGGKKIVKIINKVKAITKVKIINKAKVIAIEILKTSVK